MDPLVCDHSLPNNLFFFLYIYHLFLKKVFCFSPAQCHSFVIPLEIYVILLLTFISLFFFFWLHPQHGEILGPGIEPAPQCDNARSSTFHATRNLLLTFILLDYHCLYTSFSLHPNSEHLKGEDWIMFTVVPASTQTAQNLLSV